ncbi:MAG: tRNA lysidine(34) synthetase TilS [Rhodocyclales bacterium GT-UBC]|nr:MAG: tRNA lysidine(34) synthetase TilS [Rhodocyclales bacterium GT-UBC]
MAASRNRLPTDLAGRVGDWLADRCAVNAHLCVGLSGGCDSVVLLHVLSRLGLGARLTALHVNHGLSSNALAWSDFCAEYCAQLGVDLQIVKVSIEMGGGGGLEAAARQARHAAFAECGADVVLLAHHRGDQAETVLFNLLRGAGVAGARGMPAQREIGGGPRLLRPLLDVSRGELEAYASEYGLHWVVDESNHDVRFSRNYLRHQVLPVLKARFPKVEESLAQAAGHFSEADILLSELALQDWSAVLDGAEDESASLKALRQLSLPRLKNLLRYRLRQKGWRAPVAARLDEFARQLLTAASDRHPELLLPDGLMRLVRGRLYWLPLK